MNLKRFTKSVMQIGISNLITLIGNVVLSLLIPVILELNDYGLYKIFTLYIGYVSLLHFGFVDGIALKFGGRNYNALDKEEMKAYFTIFSSIEIVISTMILILGLVVVPPEYVFILLSVVLNIVVVNITSYFQLLSQAVKRFKELATRNIINSVLQCLSVGTLYVLFRCCPGNLVSYKLCIVLNLAVKLVLLIWYLLTYRDIVGINFNQIKKYWRAALSIFKSGLPITWAAMIANFILILDRQFVSILFDSTTYAIYAFAYTLFGLLLSMIQSVSTVLYPMIKENTNEKEVFTLFPLFTSWIQILAAAALVFYQPLCLIVEWILPKYIDSLSILSIIFPGVLFTCVVSVVTMTFYKYKDLGGMYFKFSLITLAIAFLTNAFAYFTFKSPQSIAWASILTLVIQYLITNWYLAKKVNQEWVKNFIYGIVILFGFYICNYLLTKYRFVCFLALYLITSCVIYNKLMKQVSGLIKRKM